MGYFFENMEPMDIQEERRKTAKERKKAEAYRKEAEGYQKKIAGYQKEAEGYQKEAEGYQRETEAYRQLLIEAWRERGDSEEMIVQRLEAISVQGNEV